MPHKISEKSFSEIEQYKIMLIHESAIGVMLFTPHSADDTMVLLPDT